MCLCCYSILAAVHCVKLLHTMHMGSRPMHLQRFIVPKRQHNQVCCGCHG